MDRGAGTRVRETNIVVAMANSSGVADLKHPGNPLLLPRLHILERACIDEFASLLPEERLLASQSPVTLEPIAPGEDGSAGPWVRGLIGDSLNSSI